MCPVTDTNPGAGKNDAPKNSARKVSRAADQVSDKGAVKKETAKKTAPKKDAAKARSVSDPSAQSNRGFLWALLALLLIVAAVIAYIVWSGRGAQLDKIAEHKEEVSFTATEKDDSYVELKSDKAAKDAKTVDLYEDFSCPHCADLAKATDDQMKDAIDKGDLIVNVHHLNFLDGQDYGTNTGHSTRALAATHVLAKNGETDAWWSLRKYLLENQDDAYSWEAKDFAEAAKAFGADGESVSEIKDGNLSEAQDVAENNAKKLDEQTGNVSSPRVLVDGKDMDIQNSMDWVKEATK